MLIQFFIKQKTDTMGRLLTQYSNNFIQISIILLFMLLGCKKSDNKIIKELEDRTIFYDKNNNVDSIYIFEKKFVKTKIIFNDSSQTYKNYYHNGVLESEGEKYNEKFVGQWKFYWTNGSLKHKFEYKIICDSCYLNQGMSFDKNGALNRQKSNFYTVKYQDKARINEKIKFLFKYNKMNKNSIVELFISSEIDKSFCDLDNKII